MIFKEKPHHRADTFDVVACYLEHEGKFIFLRRHPDKSHGAKWCLPAGKVNINESIVDAVVREVKEETGITIIPSELETLPSFWVESEGDINFKYHSFLFKLPNLPSVTLNDDEHLDYVWATPTESLELDLLHDLGDFNRLFFKL